MKKRIKCPNCGIEVSLEENPYRPFCSERCKMTDLGSWADEKYSIAGDEVSKEDTNKETTYH